MTWIVEGEKEEDDNTVPLIDSDDDGDGDNSVHS